MPYLELHDHGWLALPAELRDRLDLRTGDRLQLELIEGGVRLRPAGQATVPEVAQPSLPVVVPDESPVKRGPGRPRKPVQAKLAEAELPLQAALDQQGETEATAVPVGRRALHGRLPKAGGRRRSKPAGT